MEEEHEFISSSTPFPMASAKLEYRLQTTISNPYWKEHLHNRLSKGKLYKIIYLAQFHTHIYHDL